MSVVCTPTVNRLIKQVQGSIGMGKVGKIGLLKTTLNMECKVNREMHYELISFKSIMFSLGQYLHLYNTIMQ